MEPRQDHERNEEDPEVSWKAKKVVMLEKALCCRVYQAEVTLLENVNRASWLLVSRRVKIKCAPAALLGICSNGRVLCS